MQEINEGGNFQRDLNKFFPVKLKEMEILGTLVIGFLLTLILKLS